ncbi:hypothetical protein [Vagococcus carniphilus]|uniref:Uncharacterized protein n=2 Tax=Vagococcus carniphilus TaxID=218144 RepID=A0A430B068_9ENTE|nr:hypothetical protein [Vagococcus carniphilus]QNN73051.1 hypothetical protein H9L18_14585 [Vagococcus carniphilus]RSU13699.1 hypothetical protein CBF28_09450 [Vagococcus carniphilus]
MIRTINRSINNINKKIGLDLTISMPSKELLAFNEKTNTVIAVACVSVGVLASSKVLFGLGVVAGIGAGVSHIEKKKL